MPNRTVALIQVAWLGSRAQMEAQYRPLFAEAAQRGATLICLPEFSLLPYFPGTTDLQGFDWAEDPATGESARFFAEMAQTHQVTVVGSIFERTPDGQYFDTATFHNPRGQLIATTRKIHIPSGVGYNETTFFKGSDQYPVIDLGGLQMAAPTCYDQWFPELARIYSMNGAQFIFYPTAIGSEPNDPTLDSSRQWQIMMQSHAIANGIFVGAANRVGKENDVTFYGSSFICDPLGNVLAQAGRDTTEVITADLDLGKITYWREFFPLIYQRNPRTYQRLLDDDTPGQAPGWLAGR